MAGSAAHILSDRRVIALSGDDAINWLDNLVAGDLTQLAKAKVAFTALLSPQGKMLFEFFVWMVELELLIDVAAAQADGLIKRLRMYKLRSRVEFRDATPDWTVVWGRAIAPTTSDRGIVTGDPRSRGDLWRGLLPRSSSTCAANGEAYRTARVHFGIGEAPDDYALGDVFPHEANMDFFGGVSFTKGCYVGQEVVSRMQNKTIVRKRVVRIAGSRALVTGAEVSAGDAVIGRIGTVAGREGLAMLRLDRVVEALDIGVPLSADGQPVLVDEDAVERYRQSVKNRPAIDL